MGDGGLYSNHKPNSCIDLLAMTTPIPVTTLTQ